MDIYRRLLDYFGGQSWWPAESEFEVVVGAILTQASSWSNVEVVVGRLKEEDLMSPRGIQEVDEEKLAEIIRPVGYYNAKTRKLKEFTGYLHRNYMGDLMKFLDRPQHELRRDLLSIYGVGDETADSILLYAAGKPSFVVDAYTKRIFSRLGLVDKDVSYNELQNFFEMNIPGDVEVYKEFHALIVELGKHYCKTNPDCGGCPLSDICGYGR